MHRMLACVCVIGTYSQLSLLLTATHEPQRVMRTSSHTSFRFWQSTAWSTPPQPPYLATRPFPTPTSSGAKKSSAKENLLESQRRQIVSYRLLRVAPREWTCCYWALRDAVHLFPYSGLKSVIQALSENLAVKMLELRWR